MNISLLKEISAAAIQYNPNQFTDEQRKCSWLGYLPATKEAIEAAEQKLGVVLPEDYKDFLQITNGFFTPNDAIEASFDPVERIDYLKNIDDFLVEVWSAPETIDVGEQLARSIIVTGIEEEQCFLLIPPADGEQNWKYWHFACWRPGQEVYQDLDDYFNSVLNSVKIKTKGHPSRNGLQLVR